ncbi:CapA family protein [Paraburkholderia terrae]
MLTQRISPNPDADFLALVEMLRKTDVTITNVEMVFPGRGRMASTTMHGIPCGVEPGLLSEFEWLGIDIYGMGHNHATDYGVSGLVASIEALEARGLTYAGVGRTLQEARAPRYFDAPDCRVAYIAAGSSNARLCLAADPSVGDVGRPGTAPLRVQKPITSGRSGSTNCARSWRRQASMSLRRERLPLVFTFHILTRTSTMDLRREGLRSRA